MTRRAVVAVNPFKETLDGPTVASACARAAEAEGFEVDAVVGSDGGDGLLDGLRHAGLEHHTTPHEVPGPLGQAVPVPVTWLDQGTAVIESRLVVGLGLVPPADRTPVRTTTRGLGLLIDAVAGEGAKRVYVGLGGSATMDGGLGMARSWGWEPRGADGRGLPDGGGSLRDLVSLGRGGAPGVRVIGLVDVDHPLTGDGGARVFARQKGAGPSEEDRLAAGLERLVELTRERDSARWAGYPGAGAAGGLGFGILVFAGGSLERGASWFLDAVAFDARLAGADVVVTAEGAFDRTSLAGKLTGEVLARAGRAGVPAVLVAPSARDVPGGAIVESGGGMWDAAELERRARRALQRVPRLPPP